MVITQDGRAKCTRIYNFLRKIKKYTRRQERASDRVYILKLKWDFSSSAIIRVPSRRSPRDRLALQASRFSASTCTDLRASSTFTHLETIFHLVFPFVFFSLFSVGTLSRCGVRVRWDVNGDSDFFFLFFRRNGGMGEFASEAGQLFGSLTWGNC